MAATGKLRRAPRHQSDLVFPAAILMVMYAFFAVGDSPINFIFPRNPLNPNTHPTKPRHPKPQPGAQ
jgi:hypothetical protein